MYQILHKIAENGNQNLWMINDKHFGHLSLSTNDEVKQNYVIWWEQIED
jgi:hypothetical protein